MAEDYVVRYGGDSFLSVQRSQYMAKHEAERFYNRVKLDVSTTWKELIYEPLDVEDAQYLIKSDSVRVIDLGLCKIAIPANI